jgi:hypothetical protein
MYIKSKKENTHVESKAVPLHLKGQMTRFFIFHKTL